MEVIKQIRLFFAELLIVLAVKSMPRSVDKTLMLIALAEYEKSKKVEKAIKQEYKNKYDSRNNKTSETQTEGNTACL